MIPIFIAEPHGSSKTALIDELVKKDTQFEKDDFQIDFLKEFQSMPTMTIFEKCIVRLYHRFYTAELANYKCRNNNTLSEKKFLIIDRSLYDSLVYIQVEKELGELSDSYYKLLLDICQKCIEIN